MSGTTQALIQGSRSSPQSAEKGTHVEDLLML